MSTVPFFPGLVEDFVFDGEKCPVMSVLLSHLCTSDLPAVRDNNDLTDPSPWNIFLHDYWGVNITSDRSHKESLLSVSQSVGVRVIGLHFFCCKVNI